MDDPSVNIEGIDKVKLLEQLWANTSCQGICEFANPSYNRQLAEKTIAKNEYIDYFCKRPIKCDLSGKVALTRLYDRDSKMSFKDVVRNIRKQDYSANK